MWCSSGSGIILKQARASSKSSWAASDAETGFWRCFLVAVQWRSSAAPVPSLWLQSLPICDISKCWDESSEEIRLQWVDWGWQLYVSLLSWMRRLQRKIQMIYCTLSQTILTLKTKKKKKSPTSVHFPPLRRFYFDEMERFHQIPRMFDIYIYMYIVQYEDFWLKFLLHKWYKIIFQCQRSAVLTSSMF